MSESTDVDLHSLATLLGKPVQLLISQKPNGFRHVDVVKTTCVKVKAKEPDPTRWVKYIQPTRSFYIFVINKKKM